MSDRRKMPEFFINAFYESKFRGNLFVIKAGGKIIEDGAALENLLENIRGLLTRGIKVLLIYGGGRAMDRAASERGIEIKKHQGRRITSKETLEMMKEVVGGTLTLRVYETMACTGLQGLSFNAVPEEWMRVSLRPKTPVDFGYVGDIQTVNARPIQRLFKVTEFIACPCLTWANDGALCNINADTIATRIAIALKADKLVFLSDVDGVQIKDERASLITAEQIPGLIKDGTASGGMRVKLENCRAALEAGVRRIHLINGLRPDALKKEIFEPVGPGTMLLRDSERQNYMNEIEAQKVIESQT